MTKTKLNIESWNRKEHFRFFSAFDDPFFGITTNVDFTTIYLEAKHDSQTEHSVLLFSNISPIATISFNKQFKR